MQIVTSRLDEIAGEDKDLKKLLLQLFSATFEKCIFKLENSFTLEDEKKKKNEWHEACHELKGSAYNLGFNELGERCSKAEFFEDDDEKNKFLKILKVINLEMTKLVGAF